MRMTRLMSVLGTVAATAGLLVGLGGAAQAGTPASAPPVRSAPATVLPGVALQAPAPQAPVPPPALPTPCGDLPVVGVAACVDLSAERTWLVRDGQVVLTAGALGGRKGYETPTGTFTVDYRDIDHVSSLYDSAPMPFSVFFNDGVAFHQGSLSSESHGCVHLAKSTARMFYDTLRVGDTVQVVD